MGWLVRFCSHLRPGSQSDIQLSCNCWWLAWKCYQGTHMVETVLDCPVPNSEVAPKADLDGFIFSPSFVIQILSSSLNSGFTGVWRICLRPMCKRLFKAELGSNFRGGRTSSGQIWSELYIIGRWRQTQIKLILLASFKISFSF